MFYKNIISKKKINLSFFFKKNLIKINNKKFTNIYKKRRQILIFLLKKSKKNKRTFNRFDLIIQKQKHINKKRTFFILNQKNKNNLQKNASFDNILNNYKYNFSKEIKKHSDIKFNFFFLLYFNRLFSFKYKLNRKQFFYQIKSFSLYLKKLIYILYSLQIFFIKKKLKLSILKNFLILYYNQIFFFNKYFLISKTELKDFLIFNSYTSRFFLIFFYLKFLIFFSIKNFIKISNNFFFYYNLFFFKNFIKKEKNFNKVKTLYNFILWKKFSFFFKKKNTLKLTLSYIKNYFIRNHFKIKTRIWKSLLKSKISFYRSFFSKKKKLNFNFFMKIKKKKDFFSSYYFLNRLKQKKLFLHKENLISYKLNQLSFLQKNLIFFLLKKKLNFSKKNSFNIKKTFFLKNNFDSNKTVLNKSKLFKNFNKNNVINKVLNLFFNNYQFKYQTKFLKLKKQLWFLKKIIKKRKKKNLKIKLFNKIKWNTKFLNKKVRSVKLFDKLNWKNKNWTKKVLKKKFLKRRNWKKRNWKRKKKFKKFDLRKFPSKLKEKVLSYKSISKPISNISSFFSLFEKSKIKFFFINAFSFVKWGLKPKSLNIQNFLKYKTILRRRTVTRFLFILTRQLINRYKQTGIYIKDFLHITFISFFFKNPKFLVKFMCFQIENLPQNKKGTKFIHFLIKVIKIFIIERPEILGIKILFKGRVNRWRRTKVIKGFRGKLAITNFLSRIEYASSSAVTKKGLLGVKLWLCYKQNFNIKLESAFLLYFNYSSYTQIKYLTRFQLRFF